MGKEFKPNPLDDIYAAVKKEYDYQIKTSPGWITLEFICYILSEKFEKQLENALKEILNDKDVEELEILHMEDFKVHIVPFEKSKNLVLEGTYIHVCPYLVVPDNMKN